MARFKVIVPFVDDMGSITPFVVREHDNETKARAALWEVNSMRAHDGLPPLSRMPAGTQYERVQETPRVVQCSQLTASDFNGAPDNTVIVKTGRASNFRVVRHSPSVFIVYGRAEFVGGSTTVRGIDAVRALLMTR